MCATDKSVDGTVGQVQNCDLCQTPQCVFIWWVRLSVRTQAFHVCKTGSIPVPTTILDIIVKHR